MMLFDEAKPLKARHKNVGKPWPARYKRCLICGCESHFRSYYGSKGYCIRCGQATKNIRSISKTENFSEEQKAKKIELEQWILDDLCNRQKKRSGLLMNKETISNKLRRLFNFSYSKNKYIGNTSHVDSFLTEQLTAIYKLLDDLEEQIPWTIRRHFFEVEHYAPKNINDGN